MNTYYCTVHKDEDQDYISRCLLEPGTDHMVFDSGYDLEGMRDIVLHHHWKVLWEMERCNEAKFDWKFKCPVGIPH